MHFLSYLIFQSACLAACSKATDLHLDPKPSPPDAILSSRHSLSPRIDLIFPDPIEPEPVVPDTASPGADDPFSSPDGSSEPEDPASEPITLTTAAHPAETAATPSASAPPQPTSGSVDYEPLQEATNGANLLSGSSTAVASTASTTMTSQASTTESSTWFPSNTVSNANAEFTGDSEAIGTNPYLMLFALAVPALAMQFL